MRNIFFPHYLSGEPKQRSQPTSRHIIILRKNAILPFYNTPYVDAFRRFIFKESPNLRDLTVEDNVRKRPLPVNNPCSPFLVYELLQNYIFFVIRPNKMLKKMVI